ncbi:hypothetical protein FOZ61_005603 [Perkinsus olseni]|uniref:Major facilitator superfamily (MFS) profile domain-containing protein n=1 Tax=Perkinsus olseni TaxID=32597 RepID=A0A7J6LGM8_PEROL|nr:hypothetical protein FOZ61_005603 [Perkinsus olseni]
MSNRQTYTRLTDRPYDSSHETIPKAAAPSSSRRGRQSHTSKLLLVYAIVFIDFVGVSIFTNVMPILVDPSLPSCLYGMGNLDQGTAYSILMFFYTFGMLFSPPLFGKLSDIYGRRPLLLVSIIGLTVAYALQAVALNFWVFASVRFLIGLLGGGRPVASAYICDLTKNGDEQIRALAWMNMAPALSFAIGPPLGGLLVGLCGPMFPPAFVAILALLVSVMSWKHLAEASPSQPESLTIPNPEDSSLPSGRRSSDKFMYFLVFTLALLSNCMYMTDFLNFPLVLKDEFGFSPFLAGATGIGDGLLVFVGNWMYMVLATDLKIRVSVIALSACASYVVSAFAPLCFNSIAGLLVVKYIVALAGPLIFGTLPQLVATISPPGRGGEFMGYFNFFLSVGNLIPTPWAGPVYEHWGHGANFYIATIFSVLCVIAFIPLIPMLRHYECPTLREMISQRILSTHSPVAMW